MLKPGQTVGIVGGGQLARMLAIAAGRLGLRTIALDPQENAPAFAFTDGKIVAAYDDQKALLRLAAQTDVPDHQRRYVISLQRGGMPGARCIPCRP